MATLTLNSEGAVLNGNGQLRTREANRVFEYLRENRRYI